MQGGQRQVGAKTGVTPRALLAQVYLDVWVRLAQIYIVTRTGPNRKFPQSAICWIAHQLSSSHLKNLSLSYVK